MMASLDRLDRTAQLMVSLLVIFALFACTAALFICAFRGIELRGGVQEVLLLLIGVLAAAFKDTVSWWLGSSLSSSQKDSTIAGTMRS